MDATQQYNEVIDVLLIFIDDHERGLTRAGRGDVVQLLNKAYSLLEQAQDEMYKDAFI
ncbi:MAG: hypothetical protein Unbinned1446contig1005_15 [Prokaryotic dsDNA virus sp.]|nr:MAG: hypothetical protein Unbinned1446contig1005_15 [Prokaryotic dsDNA virus sp.]|tara:strand:+ start:660 stop:833 length:174 start_codon:yes stop_codon:yes gene_type:complete